MSARASRLAACRVYRCQLMAVPFAVRYPANVRSCKQVGRLPGVSLPAHGSALRCPLPGKCPLVQARRPLAGCIAQKNRQPHRTVCFIAMEACGEELPICPLFYFSLEIR